MDESDLMKACYKTARMVLWQTPNPQDINDIIDSDQIDSLKERFYQIAMSYVEFVEESDCDPNLITRAVLYLADVHAIPPMKEDVTWVEEKLGALIEIACPNIIPSEEAIQFLADIENGIRNIRMER